MLISSFPSSLKSQSHIYATICLTTHTQIESIADADILQTESVIQIWSVKKYGLISNLNTLIIPNYNKLHEIHHPEIYSQNITVEKNQNTSLVQGFKPTPPPFNFLTDHFRLVECLNYPEGSPLAHTISIQHLPPTAQVYAHTDMRNLGLNV